MKTINTLKKTMMFTMTALALSMVSSLGLVACKSDLVANHHCHGPGCGGTGPINPPPITTSNEIILVTHDSNNSGTGGTDNHAPIVNGAYLVRKINASSDTQICGAFTRSISLISPAGEEVNSLVINDNRPIKVSVNVSNTHDSNQMERRQNCQSFKVSNNEGTLSQKPSDKCEVKSENLLYTPMQIHIYTANLNHLITETGGVYKLSYVNDSLIEGSKTVVPCDTFIELEISKQ